MIRRDRNGVTHYASPPTPHQLHTGNSATGAFCDPSLNTWGDLWSVPQEGPTCLWCLVVFKKAS